MKNNTFTIPVVNLEEAKMETAYFLGNMCAQQQQFAETTNKSQQLNNDLKDLFNKI